MGIIKQNLYVVFIFCLMITGCAGPEAMVPPEEGEATPVSGTAMPTPTPAAGFWSGENNVYRLGPGDILKITVYGEPDISGLFRVSHEGTISWSWVGDIKVSGLTETEILDRLKEILTRDYIRQPRVDLTVAEYHSQVVYFFGNVSNPGIRRLGENRSLLTNFLQAGGPKLWGDGVIGILRSDAVTKKQEQITVNLQSLLRGGDDLFLQDEDIITVSVPETAGTFTSENRVYVVGAVTAPGSFHWNENMTALDALMDAGGLADYASGNRARLVRGKGEQQKEIEIEYDDILDGERDKNINLLPGDLIIVPESWI